MGHHQSPPYAPPSYEWVDLPEGPQPLPEWLKDARVEWAEGFGNAPMLKIMATPGVGSWEGKRWRRHGDALYAAVNEDGRADFLSASGRPTLEWLPEKLPITPPIKNPKPYMGSTFWGVRRVWATPQTEGFAGRHIDLMMENGVTLVLRGAWHGGSMPGYQQVSYYETGARRYRGRPGKPATKWDTLGYFGLFIRDDLWLKTLARFAPECRAARVTKYGRTSLEPVAGHWDEPKHWKLERERAARIAAREGEAA